MRFVRVWLPVIIIAGGVVVIVATGGSETGVEGGAGIIGAGASVWLLNVIFRVGVQGERDRDAEDEARDFYAEHGYWPDEAPPDATRGAAPGTPPGAPERGTPPRPGPHREPPPHRGDRQHHEPHPRHPGGTARRPPRRP